MRHLKPTAQHFPTVLKSLAILSALATLTALAFLPSTYHRNNSPRWPTTPGVIRAAALKTQFTKPRVTPRFTPTLCYTYTLDAIPRSSTRIDFASGPRRLPKDQALDWLNRNYPEGKQVTVYYDPKNPDLAVLVPGAKDRVVYCWSAAATAALCCAASLLLLTRQKRRLASDAPARIIS